MISRSVALILLGILGSAPAVSAENPPAQTKIALADSPFTPVVKPGLITIEGHSESLLAQTLMSIAENHLDTALLQIESLLRLHPDFRLAQLIHGDLLLAHAQPLGNIGNINAPAMQLNDLREEARVRLNNYLQPAPEGKIPQQLLQIDTSIPTVLVVDTSKSRLYVFKNQNGTLTNIANFYVTIGKNGTDKTREGDQRTPLGVYNITSELQGSKLPDVYGMRAFPLNFPNDWDHKVGISGHGIWLHGTYSGTYSRPPKASDGCVVLTNSDLLQLAQFLTPGNTPVIITNQVSWVSPRAESITRALILKQIANWRHDWESRDMTRYLRHYASNFTADQTGFADWQAIKRRVNKDKTWIKISLSKVSIFEYPGPTPMYMVSFEQGYQSNNLHNEMYKRQYWIQQNGQWKIIAENGI